MSSSRVTQARNLTERLFPERHVYLRSGGETRGYILTTRRQIIMAGTGALLGAWLILASASTVWTLVLETNAEREVQRITARSERLIADRDARLDSAVARLNETAGSIGELADTIEKRHRALQTVFGAGASTDPAADQAAGLQPRKLSPVERIMAVRFDQERLVARAETVAHDRAERLRLALRLAGINAAPQPGKALGAAAGGLGGPLVDASDPRALAAVLDVDQPFAARIQRAVADMGDIHSLEATASRVPLGRPAFGVNQTSGFGIRADPFDGRAALHTGLDFAGPFLTPIYATAPGTIAFTGPRSGYGNVVEIDHGNGFRTRYAHLAAFAVHVGDRVAVGQRIAAMGSTGRSTGPHVHYEIWVDGKPRNPLYFVRAGDYVQQK